MADITETYPDYAAALATCGVGYDDGALADVVAYKTAAVAEIRVVPEREAAALLAVSLAANATAPQPVRVLDFGGGCGYHYFNARAALAQPLRWAVVELPTMVARAAQFASDSLSFHCEIEDAVAALGGVDLVFTAGALQYTHDPKAMQQRLLALGAPYVLLARFPIWGLATAVGIQVVGDVREVGVGPMPRHLPGGSMRCPVTLLNIDEARHCIAQAYEVAVLLDSPNDGYTLNGVAAFMGTYILRARR